MYGKVCSHIALGQEQEQNFVDEREGVEDEEEDDLPAGAEEVEAGVRGEGVGDELPGHPDERNADSADGADAPQGSAQWC